MAVSIRKITLWRTQVVHRPRALPDLLEPLALAGTDLQNLMGYRTPNRIDRALADSGVNIAFLVAQVVGRRYSAVFGFESEADLDKAVDRIRAALTVRP